MGMISEFKDFAAKGNMLDMAVGIVIGAAFGTVIKSLVDDILMPVIASIVGSPDFSNLFVILQAPTGTDINMESIAAVREAGGVALGYGLFFNAFLAFLIVAMALFFVVKGANASKKAEAEAPAPPPAPSAEETLLTEIRDLLKTR